MTENPDIEKIKTIMVENENKTADEIYQDIVQDVKDMYGSQLTEDQAHDAARTLISFCSEIMCAA